MTTERAAQLRDDFTTWTGGFEPESAEQIESYIDGSLGVAVSNEEARADLQTWMVAETMEALNTIAAILDRHAS